MESTQRIRSATACLCALAVLQLGCWTKKANKTMTPEPVAAGFVELPEEMRDTEGGAFSRAWGKPGFWFNQYQSIQVAPVDVSHLLEMGAWADASLEGDEDVAEKAQELATEMQEKFVKALREYPDSKLAVVEAPSEGTLILEMAILQVVPSKAWLGAVGIAAWAAGPLGIAVGAATAMGNQASMAVAGRIRDASTGEIIGKFADKENARTRPLNFEAMTWYGHCHEIIDAWAEQFTEIANGPPGVRVEDDSFFSLKPW